MIVSKAVNMTKMMNIQLFAEAGTLVNTSAAYVNAHDGTSEPFEGVNTLSGGDDHIAEISAAIRAFLKGYEIVSVDDYGGNMLQPDIMLQAVEGGFIPRLNAAVDAVSAYNPELYVLAGGDGIAAYVADRLLAKDPTCKPKFVGVAMGTANVGPIISFTAKELAGLTPEDLHFESCGAVEALSCGKHAAYGFNDIV